MFFFPSELVCSQDLHQVRFSSWGQMVSYVLFFTVISSRIPMRSRLRNALSWIQFGQYSSDFGVNSTPLLLEESPTTLLLDFIKWLSPVSLLMAHILKVLDSVPCPAINVLIAGRILLGISHPVLIRFIWRLMSVFQSGTMFPDRNWILSPHPWWDRPFTYLCWQLACVQMI